GHGLAPTPVAHTDSGASRPVDTPPAHRARAAARYDHQVTVGQVVDNALSEVGVQVGSRVVQLGDVVDSHPRATGRDVGSERLGDGSDRQRVAGGDRLVAQLQQGLDVAVGHALAQGAFRRAGVNNA